MTTYLYSPNAKQHLTYFSNDDHDDYDNNYDEYHHDKHHDDNVDDNQHHHRGQYNQRPVQ